MSSKEKQTVLDLLLAWERKALSCMYQLSSDFDSDRIRIEVERKEWLQRLGISED